MDSAGGTGMCPTGDHVLEGSATEMCRYGQVGPVRVLRRRTCCQPPAPPPTPADLAATADQMWLDSQIRLATE